MGIVRSLRRTAQLTIRAVRLLRRLPTWLGLLVALALLGPLRSELWAVAGLVALGCGGIVTAVTQLQRRRQPLIVDWSAAERQAVIWLRCVGGRDVRSTGPGADGGIDVLSRTVAVQVKHTAARVGRPVIQQTYGAACSLGLNAVVMATGGFTKPAIEFAESQQVALFVMELDGRVRAVNRAAHEAERIMRCRRRWSAWSR